jgi:hypothetical protein
VLTGAVRAPGAAAAKTLSQRRLLEHLETTTQRNISKNAQKLVQSENLPTVKEHADHVRAANKPIDTKSTLLVEKVMGTLLEGETGVQWTHCRLMVLGGGGVGKTSCINALAGAPFEKECESTIGAQVLCTPSVH